MKLHDIDLKIISFCKRAYIPVSRLAFFITYFYFGILKIFGDSPASPLAEALTRKTIGIEYYHTAFLILAVLECAIGIMILIPKLTRVVLPLLMLHLIIVCSPLILVSEHVFSAPFVPTLEGQYVIKNIALAAIAIGIAASTVPLSQKKRS